MSGDNYAYHSEWQEYMVLPALSETEYIEVLYVLYSYSLFDRIGNMVNHFASPPKTSEKSSGHDKVKGI
jgi:hypothetical protein